MIKIITGYSGPGGSTIALRNLCSEFRKRDIECEMFGPSDWFIEDPKYHKTINEISLNEKDKIISHYIDLGKGRLPNDITLFCHELWWFDFNKISDYYNRVVFLNERQRDFHCSKAKIKEHHLIPNVKEPILCIKSDLIKNVAGIIGAIEPRKNTKESIERALKDKCSQILLFGVVQDREYFEKEIGPYLNENVRIVGFAPKSTIYSSVGKVYHSSKGEVASLVKDECYTTGTEFFGNEETANEVSKLTNDEVIEKWKSLLNI